MKIATFFSWRAYSISAWAGNVQIRCWTATGKPCPSRGGGLPSATTAATAPSLLQASPTIEQERMRFVPALTVVAHRAPRCALPTRTTGTTTYAATPGAARCGSTGCGQFQSLSCAWRARTDGKPANFADVKLDTPGVVLLGCHLHGSMRGHVFVTDSAWTLKTDSDGIARFASVPDGAAQVRVACRATGGTCRARR